MSDTASSQLIDLGGIVSNAFGEHAFFAVNRNLFKDSDASSVFRTHFGEALFAEDTFFIVVGTDSGLLYQYIKAHGTPKGSQYLFVELPQILNQLNDLDDPAAGLSVSTEKDWQERANDLEVLNYAIQEQCVLIRSLGVVHGHFSDYSSFVRRIEETFNTFMDKQRVAMNHLPFILRQIENLSENQVPATFLKELFSGKTAVVLAGGPSLAELLPWVQMHRQNLLVIAVSRISHSLLEADIHPDIIVSVDPYPVILSVSKDMLKFQDKALLINANHLSSNLLACWGGKKSYVGGRYPWPTTLEPEPENLPLITGTVTNTAITVAVEAGVKQVILGGVDLCFSQEGYTHAKGSTEHALGSQPMYGSKRVTTNSGRMADTHFQFTSGADELDRQAERASKQGCQIVNPARGAMRLSHVQHQSLDAIEISPLSRPAQETIDDALPSSNEDTRAQLYKEDLGEVDRMLEELRNIKSLSLRALKYNKRFFNKDGPKGGFHNNEKLNQIEKQLNEKYAETTAFTKNYGIYRIVPVLRHSEQHEDELEENSRLYFQAMIDTSTDIIDTLQRSRRRILSRLEEDKAQPNMQLLFDQWRDDQQLGRAIQWAQYHPRVVDHLPTDQKKELHEFQGHFDKYLKKLDRLHFLGIEKGVNLTGLNARAREYFQCRDETGLNSLLAGLKKHRDPEQAKLFIPLVQGYLSELSNKPEIAIEHYQHISEGPTHIDALMRLFELHIQAEDLTSSLGALKTLSGISSTYSPMYADLLQSMGDVDTAVNIYTDYLLANPEDLGSMMKLGNIFYQHQSFDGVEWTMNYILGKDPLNETAKAMLRSIDQQKANNE